MIFRKADKNGFLTQLDIEKIVDLNQGAVTNVAKKYFNYHLSYQVSQEELMQAGNMGLIKAIHKYDYSNARKSSFFTYCFFWIKAEIQQFQHTNQSVIRTPLLDKHSKAVKNINVQSLDKVVKGFEGGDRNIMLIDTESDAE